MTEEGGVSHRRGRQGFKRGRIEEGNESGVTQDMLAAWFSGMLKCLS